MKTLSTLAFVFFAATVFAQTTVKDFSINLSESTLNVKPGDKGQVTVSLTRSSTFAKSNVKLGTSTVLPKGVTLQFEPAVGNFETSVMTILVAADVVPSAFNVIINADINHKTKGTILKLVVANEVVVSK